jgi:DNA ligase (NAD+)
LLKHITIKTVSGPLKGKSFCITGALSMKRGDVEKLILDNGGEVKSQISHGLSYLIQADPKSSSSKTKKALELGSLIISEEDFKAMI